METYSFQSEFKSEILEEKKQRLLLAEAQNKKLLQELTADERIARAEKLAKEKAAPPKQRAKTKKEIAAEKRKKEAERVAKARLEKKAKKSGDLPSTPTKKSKDKPASTLGKVSKAILGKDVTQDPKGKIEAEPKEKKEPQSQLGKAIAGDKEVKSDVYDLSGIDDEAFKLAASRTQAAKALDKQDPLGPTPPKDPWGDKPSPEEEIIEHSWKGLTDKLNELKKDKSIILVGFIMGNGLDPAPEMEGGNFYLDTITPNGFTISATARNAYIAVTKKMHKSWGETAIESIPRIPAKEKISQAASQGRFADALNNNEVVDKTAKNFTINIILQGKRFLELFFTNSKGAVRQQKVLKWGGA